MSFRHLRTLAAIGALFLAATSCELNDESEPCVDGEAGCYCTTDEACGEGLACIGTTCLPVLGSGNRDAGADTSDPDSRADLDGVSAVQVRFADGGFEPDTIRVPIGLSVSLVNGSSTTARLDVSLLGFPGPVSLAAGESLLVSPVEAGTFVVLELDSGAQLTIDVVR